MRVLRSFLIVGAFLAADLRAADDGETALPPPGSWARYHTVHRGPRKSEDIGEMTLRFLGSEIHDGQNCRWIEMRSKFEDFELVEQYLATEQALRENSRPLRHPLKCRVRKDDDDWIELTAPIERDGSNPLLWLPGARRAAEKIEEPRAIEYQRGRLTSAQAYRSIQQFDPKIDDTPEPMRFEHTVWLHPDVPTGHVCLRTLIIIGAGDSAQTWRTEQTLQDFGRGTQ